MSGLKSERTGLVIVLLLPLFLFLSGCVSTVKLTVIKPLEKPHKEGSGKIVIDSCVNEVKKVNICPDLINQIEYVLLNKSTGTGPERHVKLTALDVRKHAFLGRVVDDEGDYMNVLVQVFDHKTKNETGKAIVRFDNQGVANYSIKMMTDPVAKKIVEYLLSGKT
jgi:hypothetical protein